MKALVYTGPGELKYLDVEDAGITSDQPLIEVDSVGICGSDMHAYLGHDDRRPAPLILGHEAAGTVVNGEFKGKRVTINPLVICHQCRMCRSGRDNLCRSRQIISMPPRDGAFAQLVALPGENLIEIPDEMRFEQAALAEPIAVSWHAVRLGIEAATSGMCENAVVFGGGAIGVAAALSFRAQGVCHITIVEPNPLRRDYLSRDGSYSVVSPEDLNGQLFDMVVDAVGNDGSRRQASAVVHPGGVVMHVGLGGGAGGVDLRRLTLQEITFIGTYTYTKQHFREACTAMFDGRLGCLDWFETRPLTDGPQAFLDILDGRVNAPKVILKPE
ncbi:MAG: alcohol dehydrogenase catalytic domain-containing protein [Aestuariivita sp.]|nr:alcohol dehydrogenase catalytic domain-containing protein [Aestuariivita sp.]